jgi:hypothetical protein
MIIDHQHLWLLVRFECSPTRCTPTQLARIAIARSSSSMDRRRTDRRRRPSRDANHATDREAASEVRTDAAPDRVSYWRRQRRKVDAAAVIWTERSQAWQATKSCTRTHAHAPVRNSSDRRRARARHVICFVVAACNAASLWDLWWIGDSVGGMVVVLGRWGVVVGHSCVESACKENLVGICLHVANHVTHCLSLVVRIEKLTLERKVR